MSLSAHHAAGLPTASDGEFPIITVSHLTKVYRQVVRREGFTGALIDLFNRRYREVRAVDDISFTIARGEIVGYIGANGAGKSTTIKILTGILVPTSGKVVVNGLVPWRERFRHTRQIGVVFGQRTQLWWDLAVIEAFRLLKEIYRVPEREFRRRLDLFVEVLDIADLLHTQVRKLSLGQRMKCDLAASLLHNPPVVFLDEPTIGLDVAVKQRIRKFIRTVNAEEKTTVILTTHDLKDIEALCPRLIILDRGRILYDGSQAGLLERFGRYRRLFMELDLRALGIEGDPASPEALDRVRKHLRELIESYQMRLRHRGGPIFSLSFDRTQISASEVLEAVLKSLPVHDLELREPDLEQIVRAIYERSSQDQQVIATPNRTRT